MATKKVNIDIIAKDKSKAALKGVRGSLDGVKKSIFNVRNAFIGLGAGLAIRSLVKTGMEIEGLQVRLKFLFGTAEEGAKAFDKMAKFASKVPFSLEEIQKGAGVLAVVSKDADELAKIMKLTGNVAAVTGLDFKTTAEQIQRSLSAGISAADLFRDRGVKSMLGFKAGAVVSVEETAEAFDRVFGEGGEFSGTTDALAKTLGGTLSMIGDKVFNFQKVLLEAGFFPELKKQFGDINKFLEDNGKSIDRIATSIGRGMATALVTTGSAILFLKDNFDKILFVLKAIIAVKIAAFFVAMSIAIQGATVSMLALNSATKRNLLIGGAAIVIFNLEKIFKLLKDITGEFKDDKGLEITITPLIDEMNSRHPEKIITQRIETELEKQQKLYKEHAHFRKILSTRLAKQQVEIDKKGLDQITNNTKDSLQALSGINRNAFEAYKRFQMAEATINAIKGASRAFADYSFPTSLAVAASSVAKGMALVAQINSTSYSGRQQGGSVIGGKPYMVGEAGKEMFVPSSNGNIISNDQLGKAVNVNFNINTVDASGFNQLLTNSRGVIVNMINSAVNETGRQAIV